MIFRVYEHYDDNQLVYRKSNECFICYELETETEMHTICLKDLTEYGKTCKCSGWIHQKCFDIWYEKEYKCPICRVAITKRKKVNHPIMNMFNYSSQIYLYTHKTLNKMSTILTVYLLLNVIDMVITNIWLKSFTKSSHNYDSN